MTLLRQRLNNGFGSVNMLIWGHQHRRLLSNFIHHCEKSQANTSTMMTTSRSKASWLLIIWLRRVHIDCGVTCICAQPKIYRLYFIRLLCVASSIISSVSHTTYKFNNNWAHNISTKEFRFHCYCEDCISFKWTSLMPIIQLNTNHLPDWKFWKWKNEWKKERKNSAFSDKHKSYAVWLVCVCVCARIYLIWSVNLTVTSFTLDGLFVCVS